MKKNTVLIIEDNEINCEILQEILQEDYELYTAYNGQEGMQLLREHVNEIDVVLLDIQMPVMNGYEVLEEVSKDPQLQHIPIVVTTGNDSTDEEERCFKLKATEFVKKPYNPVVVRLRVENLIRMRDFATTLSDVETDKNTGVYTRNAFVHYAREMIKANPDEDYTLTITDIRGFRVLHDQYGNSAYRVLRKQIDMTKAVCTDKLIVGSYSPDQLIFIHPTVHREMTADNKKRWYEISLQKLSRELGAVVNAGISEHLDTSVDLDNHIRNVYAALNEVKKIYNRYTYLVGNDVLEKMQRDIRIKKLMEKALSGGEMQVYYQPKHDARTNEMVGAEALIRWNSPELGFVSPGDFIPIFERNGFVSEVDAFVWRETCKNQRKWIDARLNVVPISVNASRHDFELEDMNKRIIQPVLEYNVPEQLMHLEITESLFNNLSVEAMNFLHQFRGRGIMIELDDFGSGYSSLNSLSELPIDIVKFDIGFVRRLSDPRRQVVMEGSADILKALHLKTIAEGVEDEDTRQKVADMGIDTIQGYLYSKPLPIHEFEKYLAEHKSSK